MNTDNTFSLREISQWTKEGAKVSLPDLQRGLVWKARQMELLWDSMLRGFPIGSFMLSDTRADKYYLMDGQQRYNAIATGFGAIDKPGAMLWLDLKPTGTQKDSTRKYWVKATTIAHPWGFKNDDNCSTLTADERRQAMASFGFEGKIIYNQEIGLEETWPFLAGKPVPLQFFLNAPLCSRGDFSQYVIDHVKDMNEKYRAMLWKDYPEEEFRAAVEKDYPVFKQLEEEYTIQCNVLPLKVIDSETADRQGEDRQSSLEILFNRLNTGGTQISQDDLNYSAIKAYWGDIKETNDEIAERYMPPSKLAMLVFRLALTLENPEKGLRNAPTIQKIRELAKNEETKKSIEALYKRLDAIMAHIEAWLDVFDKDRNCTDAMPAFIRTSIARKSPEVFLLLMYLAAKEDQVDAADIKGLALLLHWFGQDKKKAAETVFQHIWKEWSTDKVRQGLAQCIEKEYLFPVYSPDELKKSIQIKEESDWTPWSENYAPWHDCYSRLSWWDNAEAQEMLLFVEREYLNETFRLYDPAREDMWESHNRPWDYDHIIPQNWIKERGRRKAKYRDFCEHWLYRIGNIGAIPFEANRSKSDSDESSVYLKNKKDLLFSDEFEDLLKKGTALPESEKASYEFGKTVFDRTMKIYDSAFALFGNLLKETNLTDEQKERREAMERLESDLKTKGYEAQKVFVAEAGGLSRDYHLNREEDWARRWISVGVQRGKFFVCFTWGYDEGGKPQYEIGLRKMLEADIEKDRMVPEGIPSDYVYYSNNPWWYAAKSISEKPDEKDVLDQLEGLLETIRKN